MAGKIKLVSTEMLVTRTKSDGEETKARHRDF